MIIIMQAQGESGCGSSFISSVPLSFDQCSTDIFQQRGTLYNEPTAVNLLGLNKPHLAI